MEQERLTTRGKHQELTTSGKHQAQTRDNLGDGRAAELNLWRPA